MVLTDELVVVSFQTVADAAHESKVLTYDRTVLQNLINVSRKYCTSFTESINLELSTLPASDVWVLPEGTPVASCGKVLGPCSWLVDFSLFTDSQVDWVATVPRLVSAGVPVVVRNLINYSPAELEVGNPLDVLVHDFKLPIPAKQRSDIKRAHASAGPCKVSRVSHPPIEALQAGTTKWFDAEDSDLYFLNQWLWVEACGDRATTVQVEYACGATAWLGFVHYEKYTVFSAYTSIGDVNGMGVSSLGHALSNIELISRPKIILTLPLTASPYHENLSNKYETYKRRFANDRTTVVRLIGSYDNEFFPPYVSPITGDWHYA